MDYQAFYQQLKTGAVQRLYLFEGEEEYGKESALTALRKALLTGPMAMMNESVLTAPADSELIAACETLPLMENRRLVIVKEAPQLAGRGREKGGDEDAGDEEPSRKGDDLTPYLPKLPETVCLVFFVRGKARANSRLYKKIKELGGLVAFDQLDNERLMKWIIREFAAGGLACDRPVAERLVFACGRELMKLKGEVAKISAYALGKKTVAREDIDAVAALSVEYRVFDLSDKVTAGGAGRALPLMAEMLRGGESRLALLALLQRHYRQLLLTRLMMDRKLSQAGIMAELGVPGFVAGKLMQAARGYPGQALKQAYLLCIDQEYLVKSGQIAEEGSLEQLVLRLIHLKKEGGGGAHA